VTDASSAARPPLSVLAVCTGNVCRSPAVEATLTAGLRRGSGVAVSSAGLRARIGEPVARDMALVLTHPLPGFAARQLDSAMIREADIVLAMTRAHRASVVTAVPAAVRKTFTLREFADLAVLARDHGALPAGSARDRLAAVAALAPRFRALRRAGAVEDIEDPYGRELFTYGRAMAQIDECLTPLLAVLKDR